MKNPRKIKKKPLKNNEKSITRKIWRKQIMPWNLTDRIFFIAIKKICKTSFLKIYIGYQCFIYVIFWWLVLFCLDVNFNFLRSYVFLTKTNSSFLISYILWIFKILSSFEINLFFVSKIYFQGCYNKYFYLKN